MEARDVIYVEFNSRAVKKRSRAWGGARRERSGKATPAVHHWPPTIAGLSRWRKGASKFGKLRWALFLLLLSWGVLRVNPSNAPLLASGNKI
ncbi:Hypothetical predicted protein [Marmota monax]|uniref:Uncharacterized protein n=1 Tax=Marmota monax TaxID=9995 RepID=A0A5E4BKP4_MARMO|nr:Hypothetical predicted protein [Marmota monax]